MRTLFGFLMAGALAIGSAAIPSASSTLVSFEIDDTFFAGGGAGVFSDSLTSGTNRYADYRIDPSDPANWCVDAEPYSPGNLFVRLNRKLDGDAGVLRCTDNPGPGDVNGTQRNFTLRINNDAACDILSDPLAGLPVTDLAGTPWDAISSTGVCALSHNDNPRIRLGTLYKAKAKTTPIDFLTVMFGEPNSYEIRSESAATITSVAPGQKTVTYSGSFRLVKFEAGERARTVGPAFTMPLRIDFHQQ